MNNEFQDSGGWGCACERMPGGCMNSAPQGTGATQPQFGFSQRGGNVCQMAHRDILQYYDVPPWNKWRVIMTDDCAIICP